MFLCDKPTVIGKRALCEHSLAHTLHDPQDPVGRHARAESQHTCILHTCTHGQAIKSMQRSRRRGTQLARCEDEGESQTLPHLHLPLPLTIQTDGSEVFFIRSPNLLELGRADPTAAIEPKSIEDAEWQTLPKGDLGLIAPEQGPSLPDPSLHARRSATTSHH